SKSSKLIHGGLRYLAQGRIGLTRSLLNERNYLVKHTRAVKEEAFDILVGRNQFGKLSIRLGLILYGLLGGGKPSRFKKNDGLYPDEVDGYFTYADCVTDDSYLTILNVVSAHQNGAICLNYVSCLGMEKKEKGITAKLQDILT
ncbi:glycerol-3-phosphate dehydrogenase, partial [mine drainage metagenome]